MKTVSVKDFQSNMYSHLSELPICVTKFGKTIFYVVEKLEEQEDTREEQEYQETKLPPGVFTGQQLKDGEIPEEPMFQKPEKNYGKCFMVQHGKCNRQAIGFFEFEMYSDGDVRTLRKEICAVHVAGIKKEDMKIREI